MIKILYNNEAYEITEESRKTPVDIACCDYSSSISDHVQAIIEVLAACDIAYELEEL